MLRAPTPAYLCEWVPPPAAIAQIFVLGQLWLVVQKHFLGTEPDVAVQVSLTPDGLARRGRGPTQTRRMLHRSSKFQLRENPQHAHATAANARGKEKAS